MNLNHSPEIEKAILGVLLDGRHKTAWQTLQETAPNVGAFYLLPHRAIILAMHRLAAAGREIDAITVIEALASMPWAGVLSALKRADVEAVPAITDDGADPANALQSVGDVNGVMDIMGAHAPAAGFKGNCEILLAYWRLRRASTVADGLSARLRAPGGHNAINAILDDAIGGLGAVRAQAPDAIRSMAGATSMALVEHDRAVAVPVTVARWGIPFLDKAVPLAAGRLITLSASPGAGKTSAALQALQATTDAVGKNAGAIASLEMPSPELGGLLIARKVGVPYQALTAGTLTRRQRELATVAQEDWQINDAWIKDASTGGCTVVNIAAWARQCHRTRPLALLIVDYVGLLARTFPKQSEYDCLCEATRVLKTLANELRMCVLMLAQINRLGTTPSRDKDGSFGNPPEPRLQDLKGSGSIEQDSDGVVFLWPTSYDEEAPTMLTNVSVPKNRFGPKARGRLVFHRAAGQGFSNDAEPVEGKADRMEREPSPGEDRFATIN